MKNEIINIIGELNDITISALKNRIENSQGELDFYFPLKSTENSNMLLVSSVSEEFIETIHNLIEEKIITFIPTDPLVVSNDGGEIYLLPLARASRPKAYKKLHWLPLLLKKGQNFPKKIKSK